jgi:hypothetical protein
MGKKCALAGDAHGERTKQLETNISIIKSARGLFIGIDTSAEKCRQKNTHTGADRSELEMSTSLIDPRIIESLNGNLI